MLSTLVLDADHIYLACGVTDFRKQIDGLATIVNMQFQLDPFTDSCVFIFCNRRRNSIKVLRYDKNGFVLATKKLLDDMKFEWPMKTSEAREVSYQQIQWLLQGLSIDQKRALHSVEMSGKKVCF